MIGWILSAIVALTLISIGIGALVNPRGAAMQYGIPVVDPRSHALIRAMGVRDLAIGAIFALLLHARARDLLWWSVLAIAPIAAMDFMLVALHRRATGARGLDKARILHAAGLLALILTAAALYGG